MADPAARRTRRSYAGTVVAGLAGAALTAVAGSRTWAVGHASAGGLHVHATVSGSQAAPLVAALGLVALAGWGVVLVTRRRARLVVAVLGLLAALGAVAAAALGHSAVGDAVTSALLQQGAGHGPLQASSTPWWLAAVLGGLVSAAAFAVAVRKAPAWPEMGRKYDAPAARSDHPGQEVAEQPDTGSGTADGPDMWRALDEGRDPTS